ncbi:LytTR family DNA-binding domain-containing protein [Sabulilitoribacter arenilitoris]|uniref:LytTR family DNA-binding domain-containing protein n=1 Tax=Wocania arenilitoris TaxID=2044858 RepID=A0AAE3EL06_9FLAO|nr:LytTR family DNA-binding domain-containing protein [Wocania arenilitoris]MCF7567253.1 LytTR family DNA-binding domain-containing protein [Wocania arenilitoris]
MNQSYKTIIIDDELLARERLLDLLENYPETFQVIDTAKNGVEAKEKISALKPDLIFLDIEMPELTGFELLEQLDAIPIVVFCTAYDQYSLKAFETNSIDYLVKPVRLERIEKTIQKLKLFNGNNNSQQLLEAIKEMSIKKETKKMTSITIKKGEKLIFVKLEDVVFLEAKDKYVTVFTNTANHLIELSLTQLVVKLPDDFLRVHRATIINTKYVEEVQKYFNNRYVIRLNNKQKTSITSGRSYTPQIKNWMDV